MCWLYSAAACLTVSSAVTKAMYQPAPVVRPQYTTCLFFYNAGGGGPDCGEVLVKNRQRLACKAS
jgi:hypothetical protein